jgi:hypothetical protein
MRRGRSAAGCLDKSAIEQTSGRERINIHGAINESGQTRMIDAEATLGFLREQVPIERTSAIR